MIVANPSGISGKESPSKNKDFPLDMENSAILITRNKMGWNP